MESEGRLTQNQRASLVFVDNRIRAMSTHVMECLDCAVFALDEDYWEPCESDAEVVAWFLEAGFVTC